MDLRVNVNAGASAAMSDVLAFIESSMVRSSLARPITDRAFP